MDIEKRINIFVELGARLQSLPHDELKMVQSQAQNENNWFTEESFELALKGLIHMLEETKIRQWVSNYNIPGANAMKIGVVMAGNIPMVGFHDLLCVLISGHKALVKLSSQDTILMRWIFSMLRDISAELGAQLEEVDRLNSADAFIATGSDNTARYFKYYFGEKPHIIRQNRTSVAILDGNEKPEDFENLGKDIFAYFGLGCRNVSKLFVPEGYSFNRLYEAFEHFEPVIHHHKYRNNYDYNKSIYLVNKHAHLDNGFLLITESEELVSPISVLYYQVYKSYADLETELAAQTDKIQCIVSNAGKESHVPMGQAQCPEIWDYADGVDTMNFLLGLA